EGLHPAAGALESPPIKKRPEPAVVGAGQAEEILPVLGELFEEGVGMIPVPKMRGREDTTEVGIAGPRGSEEDEALFGRGTIGRSEGGSRKSEVRGRRSEVGSRRAE